MKTAQNIRPAVDIEEDLRHLFRSFDPIKQATHHLSYHVEDGKVTISGHVRPTLAKRVLIDNIPDIEGVVDMDASNLYDDETLRLELGRVIPNGIIAKVNFGHVLLYGATPDNADDLVANVQKVAGVKKVQTQFI